MVPADDRVAEKHPSNCPEREVGAERQFERPDASTQDEGDQANDGAVERASEDGKKDGTPTQESADAGQEFQVAAAHRFPGNLNLVSSSTDFIQLVEFEILRTNLDTVVVKGQNGVGKFPLGNSRAWTVQP